MTEVPGRLQRWDHMLGPLYTIRQSDTYPFPLLRGRTVTSLPGWPIPVKRNHKSKVNTFQQT
jgi:hypothetical protein